MIQDIYPHIFNNQFDCRARAGSEDMVLNICDGKILIDLKAFDENRLAFPRVKDIDDVKESAYTYLFAIDDTRYYLFKYILEGKRVPSGYGYVEERSLRREGMGPDENLFAAITGKHLSDWYRDTQFCGRCGHKMLHKSNERAMSCEVCHYTAYPRIMPAVIVGVINGEKMLITRYRTGFAHNALIAGFTEIGETVEETVAREVMEEAGVRVKNIRYYKSQPWGSANDILLGFYCDVDGDDTITMDSEELKYAEWVNREDIALQPGNFSLTNEMMRRFKTGEMC
ncbi:MAG: NAD(+) diphosphatase [Lachnospiraceae bacterium]